MAAPIAGSAGANVRTGTASGERPALPPVPAFGSGPVLSDRSCGSESARGDGWEAIPDGCSGLPGRSGPTCGAEASATADIPSFGLESARAGITAADLADEAGSGPWFVPPGEAPEGHLAGGEMASPAMAASSAGEVTGDFCPPPSSGRVSSRSPSLPSDAVVPAAPADVHEPATPVSPRNCAKPSPSAVRSCLPPRSAEGRVAGPCETTLDARFIGCLLQATGRLQREPAWPLPSSGRRRFARPAGQAYPPLQARFRVPRPRPRHRRQVRAESAPRR